MKSEFICLVSSSRYSSAPYQPKSRAEFACPDEGWSMPKATTSTASVDSVEILEPIGSE